MTKISDLFSELEQLHRDENTIEREIKAAILEGASSESDYF